MAHIKVPVDNTDATVTRVAAEYAIRTIMDKLNIQEVESIKYIPRGTINNVSPINPAGPLALDTTNAIIVEYNETFDTEVGDSNDSELEYQPLWVNKKIGVAAVPLHKKVKLEITFTYRNINYDDMVKCLNTYRAWQQKSVTCMYHDIGYNYTLPEEVLAYLNQCYQLTESVAPYGKSLKDFMLDSLNIKAVNIRKNLIGTKERLVFNGLMKRCLGIFTSEPDMVETSKEPPISALRFVYVMRYERISDIKLIYQKYIHNQHIDISTFAKFYSKQQFFDNGNAYRPASHAADQVTESSFNVTPPILRIPGDNDGWKPSFKTKQMEVLLIEPVQVDKLNKRSILNLVDLVEFGLSEEFIDNLKPHCEKLLIPYKWFFYLEIFAVNERTYKIPIEFTDNYDLVCNVDMDLRTRHYLQFSLCKDVSKIDYKLLQQSPTLLQYFFDIYGKNVDLEVIGLGRHVTKRSILDAVNIINNTNNRPYPYYLVGCSTIFTRKITHADLQ